MVMHASGILRPTAAQSSVEDKDDESDRLRKDALWDVTWGAIDQFCPKLKQDFINVVNGCMLPFLLIYLDMSKLCHSG